jgi:hypothetical protein
VAITAEEVDAVSLVAVVVAVAEPETDVLGAEELLSIAD